MIPDKDGTELLEEFFSVLGYGNKCTKCHRPGKIKKVTRSLINFQCKPCKIFWAFDMHSIMDDITKIKKLRET